ncbi:hypothetical protein [Fodinicola acaciae]|nr:hypothetical protein [Fodinicola acaciae]
MRITRRPGLTAWTHPTLLLWGCVQIAIAVIVMTIREAAAHPPVTKGR